MIGQLLAVLFEGLVEQMIRTPVRRWITWTLLVGLTALQWQALPSPWCWLTTIPFVLVLAALALINLILAKATVTFPKEERSFGSPGPPSLRGF